MSYPHELKYDENHHWSRIQDDGTVVVGITGEFVRRLTGMAREGEIVHVQLPGAGAQLARGQDAGAIEGSEALSTIFSPIAGTVTASNGELGGSPLPVRDDPYGDGWLFTIRPANPADLNGLMDALAYSAYVEKNG